MTTTVSRRTFLLGAALGVVAAASVDIRPSLAGRHYTGLVRGTAVGGYDPVAYFTQSKAIRGAKDITTEWDGVTWRFASAENRDLFTANPTKYAPQYGGFCAYAVGYGSTAKGDPKQWKIVDGKLYLNYNRSIKRKWERKQSSLIKAADKNWPKLSQ
ncbi:MAG: YHS domain-containing (seleno)protein [Pseudomonadota bacterium]